MVSFGGGATLTPRSVFTFLSSVEAHKGKKIAHRKMLTNVLTITFFIISCFYISSVYLLVIFINGFEHGHNIFGRYIWHNIVNRIKHIPPSFTENFKITSDMIFHLLRCGKIQNSL